MVVLTRRSMVALLTGAATLPRLGHANVAPPRSEIRAGLAKRFTDLGTAGTFVAYEVDEYRIIASDTQRSAEPRPPGPTFAIPNALIALETGIVQDADQDVFAGDGVKRAASGEDTLRSAFAASVVRVDQEIAARIGPERMQKYLHLFEYGNRNIGGGIDQFWLTGNLRIDPMDQIDFVDRLRRRTLPISRRSQDVVCDILPVTQIGASLIRAKSGLTDRDQVPLGWLVGWAEKGQAHTVFALNMDCPAPHQIAELASLAQACLADIGGL